jgi:hypothetical protein
MLRGIVHDPTARRMGGVAGHAGLFSTGDDLALFAEDFLSGFTDSEPFRDRQDDHAPAAAQCHRVARAGMGYRFAFLHQSRRAAARGFVRPHRLSPGLRCGSIQSPTPISFCSPMRCIRGGKSTVSLRCKVATAVVQALNLTVAEQDKCALRDHGLQRIDARLAPHRRKKWRRQDGIDVLEAHNFRELHANAIHPVRVGW